MPIDRLPTTGPPQQASQRPWPCWVSLAGSLLIGISFVLPWTELLGRAPTGWQLFTQTSELLERLEQAKKPLDRLPSRPVEADLPEPRPAEPQRQRPGRFPQGRPGPRLPAPRLREARELKVNAPGSTLAGRVNGDRIQGARDRLGQARSQVDQTVSLTHDILLYAQLAMLLLLVTALLPGVRLLVTQHAAALGLSVLMGIAGLAFTGSAVVLFVDLGQLEVLGQPIPLQSGFWSATLGCSIMGIAGSILIWRPQQRHLLAVVLLPSVVWTAYFAHLLGVV